MQRGEVYELATSPLSRGDHLQGRDQRERRLAVVVQSTALPLLSTVVVVPTSTTVFEAQWHVAIAMPDTTTYALCEQVSAVDPSRLGSFRGMTSYEELRDIDDALRLVQDL
ncbi:mRNA interferase MazF [Quadrisphaera granulorum]|uniref:mRNA interferase MazF n=1 Tax=Quadrisphaera granulorum TaxID=317664 RepID=A0A315ZSB9_9ACTN|nr:type II toxin-antitoxin system PemK/MazF family toxin [Quadrisphaera granulorum]PWJ48455.1 mRNA interferase MazF [Quadrisphaera granulorum]SZE98414.1 mRNA interferase MazF [Quadrisphaera granulorum]